MRLTKGCTNSGLNGTPIAAVTKHTDGHKTKFVCLLRAYLTILSWDTHRFPTIVYFRVMFTVTARNVDADSGNSFYQSKAFVLSCFVLILFVK